MSARLSKAEIPGSGAQEGEFTYLTPRLFVEVMSGRARIDRRDNVSGKGSGGGVVVVEGRETMNSRETLSGETG